jgi:hypothetical protein
MDPINWTNRGFFSAGCRVIPDTIAAGNDRIITKWATVGNQRSWAYYRSAAQLFFIVSDDGTNTDTNSIAVFTADALYSFVGSFDPSGGSGACENNLYYDAYQVDTDATMTECAPVDSTADLEIGAFNVGTETWDGSILECALWEKELSAIEANKFISPYFPGTDYGDGFWVDTCSQAASHATCSTQVCRDGTPNACQAEGTGVMALFGGYTEQLDNNSFEAYVGDPSDGDFSDWPTEAGAVTAYLADSKHGDVSARMQGGSMTSECIIGGGNDTYFEISAKQLNNGGGTIEVWLREYDTGFCTSQLALTTIITCTPGGVYDDCGALFAAASWNVATSSYAIQIVDSVDGDVLIDNVSIKEASYHTPWVENPSGGVTTTYNSRDDRLHNPLSDYCESEGADCYASGFCATAWVYTDWAGDDGATHTIFNIPGTVGNNNRWRVYKDPDNNIYFDWYDSAANLHRRYLAVTDTNFTSGDWDYIEVCSDNSTLTKAHHYNVANGTWYDWTITSGAYGIHNDQSVEFHLGHMGNTVHLDGYQSEIHISPYNAIYPNVGFNNGNPPINGSPY